MPDESAITLTKAAEAQLMGKSILPMIADPDGVPADFRVNFASISDKFYKLSPTIGSSNLTVAVQHLDGTSPSATNPMAFKVGDSIKVATSALAFTKVAGTNWMNAGSSELAALPTDFFVYVLNETGASAGLKLLISRIPFAETMADFVNTATDEKYPAGNWVNFNATDQVQVIGRIRAQLSAGASYNWSIVTGKVISRPIYETDWLDYIPVTTGFSANPTGGVIRYQVRGSTVQINYVPANPGTSNATGYSVTSPFIAKNLTGYYQYFALGWTYDNTAHAATGSAFISPGTRAISLTKTAFGAWTTSGTKIANFSLFLEI